MLAKKKVSRKRIYDTRYDTKKMFVPLSTNFRIRKYIRKDGTSQIYLHVISNGVRERIALDLYIRPKDWLESKQRARNRGNEDFNLILDNLKASITEIKTQFRLTKQVLTIDKFIYEFNSDFSRIDFLAFMITQLNEQKNSLSNGAFRRNKAVYTKLTRFKKQILFSDVNFQMLQRIRKYLKELGNCENTIESNFSVIRKFLRLAKKHGIHFPLDVNDIKVKVQKGNRVALKPEEVKNMFEYFCSSFIPEEKRIITGYFLFSCFTGIRIGDLQKLNREEIGESFQIITNKNSKPLTINLTKKAKKLIELEPLLFVKKYSDKHLNEKIKLVAKAVGIEKHVTFHVARHSFATNYLRMGGNVVYLKELLGHSDLKTTMLYVYITEEEKNKEIDLLDNMF